MEMKQLAVLVLVIFVASVCCYKVDYEIYHDYARFQSDLLGIAKSPENKNIVRLRSGRETTHTKESIYLLHLSNHRRPFVVRNKPG